MRGAQRGSRSVSQKRGRKSGVQDEAAQEDGKRPQKLLQRKGAGKGNDDGERKRKKRLEKGPEQGRMPVGPGQKLLVRRNEVGEEMAEEIDRLQSGTAVLLILTPFPDLLVIPV